MGLFHEMVSVFNRAPVKLTVRFDGQETDIPVGESSLPKICVGHAKNQNPIMGTADADNPSMSGCQYLIGVKGTKDNCSPLTQEEWEAHLAAPCRINMDEFLADKLGPKDRIVVRGRGRNSVQAKSSFDAGVRIGSPEVFAGARD